MRGEYCYNKGVNEMAAIQELGSPDPSFSSRRERLRLQRIRQIKSRPVKEVKPGVESAEGIGLYAVRKFVEESDLPHIVSWAQHPHTRLHLEPPPMLITDMYDADQRNQALVELREYYGDPNTIPYVALSPNNRPIGIADMRVFDDDYIQNQESNRSPVLRRLVVDPNFRRHGIGADLAATMIFDMFLNFRGYTDVKGQPAGADRIYAWTMDRGNVGAKIKFFHDKLGFDIVGHWDVIAERRGFPYIDNALLWMIKQSWFMRALNRNPEIQICANIIEKQRI